MTFSELRSFLLIYHNKMSYTSEIDAQSINHATAEIVFRNNFRNLPNLDAIPQTRIVDKKAR